MAELQKDARARLGQELRRMRAESGATLDEAERITRMQGMRVTRSHLSRVENGQADLSVLRFLSLMGAFGKPVGSAAEELLAPVHGAIEDPSELARRASSLLREHSPDLAANLLRAALSPLETPLSPELPLLWGWAEARLGRWRAAFRILVPRIVGRRPDPALLSTSCVAALATGRGGIARSFAWAVRHDQPAFGCLLEAALALADGDPGRCLSRLDDVAAAPSRRADRGDTAAFRHPEALALQRVLRGLAYMMSGQDKIAARTLGEHPEPAGLAPAVAAGWRVAQARLARNTGSGKRAVANLEAALARIRQHGLPDYVARLQLERAEVLRDLGRRGPSAAAERAAAAIIRRYGSDREICASGLPIHGLMELAAKCDAW